MNDDLLFLAESILIRQSDILEANSLKVECLSYDLKLWFKAYDALGKYNRQKVIIRLRESIKE